MSHSRQDAVLAFLNEYGQATNQDVAELLGVNSKAAYDVYRRLRDAGLVQRIDGVKLTFSLAPGWNEKRRQQRGGRGITGREAIKWYLARHERLTVSECAMATGASAHAVSVAAAKMASAGELVLDERVWKTNYYRLPDPENRGINTIFDECRRTGRATGFTKFSAGCGYEQRTTVTRNYSLPGRRRFAGPFAATGG